MTAYEQGFLTKCAEYGVPYEVADFMYKMAAPPTNWRAQRPTISMGAQSVMNKAPGPNVRTYIPPSSSGASTASAPAPSASAPAPSASARPVSYSTGGAAAAAAGAAAMDRVRKQDAAARAAAG